ALLHGHTLAKAWGIEILPQLALLAQSAVSALFQLPGPWQVKESTDDVTCGKTEPVKVVDAREQRRHRCDVCVYQGDLLDLESTKEEGDKRFDWTQANIVFANSTCFSDTLFGRMSLLA
ncbi:unnamed protein product, partial [Discosporangium mesarthrocarpum]